jgi:hypothetical protein
MLDEPMLMMVVPVALIGLLQVGPVILSSGDIGDNYYDAPPVVVREQTTWLGLFIKEGKSDQKTRESHLEVTRVRFVPRKESGTTVYRLVTTPPGAALLLSGVPRLSAGAAVTVSQDIDLGAEKREAEFRVGSRRYMIRLDSKEPNYCDAVIILTQGGRRQKLFDATAPATTNDPALVVSCDEPHFTVHWAGDLDRDGRLDMLVTFSQKYSYHPRQLFLSSGARSGELVAEVARYERFAE